jgi:hypothetical protein
MSSTWLPMGGWFCLARTKKRFQRVGASFSCWTMPYWVHPNPIQFQPFAPLPLKFEAYRDQNSLHYSISIFQDFICLSSMKQRLQLTQLGIAWNLEVIGFSIPLLQILLLLDLKYSTSKSRDGTFVAFSARLGTNGLKYTIYFSSQSISRSLLWGDENYWISEKRQRREHWVVGSLKALSAQSSSLHIACQRIIAVLGYLAPWTGGGSLTVSTWNYEGRISNTIQGRSPPFETSIQNDSTSFFNLINTPCFILSDFPSWFAPWRNTWDGLHALAMSGQLPRHDWTNDSNTSLVVLGVK